MALAHSSGYDVFLVAGSQSGHIRSVRIYARLDCMSSTIRATCDHCGTVEVPVESARLELALDGDPRNTALLTCPSCGGALAQRVTERATRLLSGAGIDVVVAAPAADRRAAADS